MDDPAASRGAVAHPPGLTQAADAWRRMSGCHGLSHPARLSHGTDRVAPLWPSRLHVRVTGCCLASRRSARHAAAFGTAGRGRNAHTGGEPAGFACLVLHPEA